MKQFALLQPIHINYLQFNVIISAIIVGVFLQVMACGSDGYSVREVGFAMNTASQGISPNEANLHAEVEAQFLSTMTQNHMQQIKLGQLAQKRSGSSDVKAIGKTMEQEHLQKLREVIALAKKKSISIPSAPNEITRAIYASLTILNGEEFDKAYHIAMAEAQKTEVSISDRATLAVTDPEIKAWAMNNVNVLKLQMEHSVVSK